MFSTSSCGNGPIQMSRSTNDEQESLRRQVACRHHLIGWCGLLLFLSLGAVLETLRGFKIGFYLDLEHKLRRELWILAHAHGTLLSLVQLGFAATVLHFGQWTEPRLKLVSFFLLDALVLMPLGFFLGGMGHSEVDPSLGILLVPLGALLLFLAVALIIHSARYPPASNRRRNGSRDC